MYRNKKGGMTYYKYLKKVNRLHSYRNDAIGVWCCSNRSIAGINDGTAPQRLVQLDDRDQQHDRQKEHDQRYKEENKRHEQEMLRRDNESRRDWHERQHQENNRHINELNNIEAFLMGVVVGVVVVN